MIAFGELLPRIRRRIDRDLARRGMAREKVLAAVVRLLELTLIRVGNEEYARVNASFGLTTLRNRHVRVRGSQVRFRFRGKGGVQHEVGIRDRRLAALIGRLQDLPGQELFEYRDGLGRVHEVTSDDVNAYLRAVASPDISAKDFRTWAATVLAFRALCALDEAASQGEAKRNVVAVVKAVATQLGNTPAVCRKAYIHPAVLDAYVEGTLVEREAARIAADVAASGGGGQVAATPYARERAADADRPDAATRAAAALAATTPHGWADPAEERAVLEFLRRRVLLGPATARAAGSAA
jgi:DNA topoisomerase-1